MSYLEVIRNAFARYGFGEIIEDPVEIRGDVDLNYIITADTGKYFLKKIINTPAISQFEFLGSLYTCLKKKDIPVPIIFKTRTGNYVEESFILYEYIDGIQRRDWSRGEMVSLVTNFAKMHEALRGQEVPDFIKNKDDKYIRGGSIQYCHEVFRSKILELQCSAEIKDSIIKSLDMLWDRFPEIESLPKYIIHGDLNEMNALFKDNKNIGIVDFGLSYDPFVYDLGVFCYWFAYPWTSSEINIDRLGIIVDTYESVIPLSNLGRELLPYMMLRRSIMDIMLALQWYWNGDPTVHLPEITLERKIKHNNKIVEYINSI